jgi:hypothetical protein
VSEKRRGVILCSYKGKWKDELEKRLETDEKVTLTAIGRIRYKLLAYLHKRQDIEIVKLETGYIKNKDKGIGKKSQLGNCMPSPPATSPTKHLGIS